MPVPAVSPRNWERTRALTQFHMGTTKIDANDLSFADQLEELIGPDYREEVEKLDPSTVTHSDFPTGYILSIDSDRDRPHRPEVSHRLDHDLTAAVDEMQSVPAEKLNFDDRLELFLDLVEEYYSALDCHLR